MYSMAVSVSSIAVDRYSWLLIFAECGIRTQRMLGVGTGFAGLSRSLVTYLSFGNLDGSSFD